MIDRAVCLCSAMLIGCGGRVRARRVLSSLIWLVISVMSSGATSSVAMVLASVCIHVHMVCPLVMDVGLVVV